MGLCTSLPFTKEELDDVSLQTGFSKNIIYSLHRRFQSLDRRHTGNLCRDDFLEISRLSLNPLRDQIIQSFFISDNGEVNFRQFLFILSHFQPPHNKVSIDDPNSRTSKLRFLFNMVNTSGDGKISQTELVAVLRQLVRVEVTEDMLMDVAERALAESDTDGDNCLDFEEFTQMCEKMEIEEKLSMRFLIA